MKRLLLLISLIVTCGCCIATPTIPAVGATLPSGEGNDGAPGNVFYLCKRVCEAARINDNGSLDYFTNTDYVEIYSHSFAKFSFHGMSWAFEPEWVTPWMPNDWAYASIIQSGSRVGSMSDGTPVYVYPAVLQQDAEGRYYIEIVFDYSQSEHHVSEQVKVRHHVKGDLDDPFPPDPDYPHDFYLEIEVGYAFFTKSENGCPVLADNLIVLNTLIEPIEEFTYAPSADADFTLSQIISDGVGSLHVEKSKYFEHQGRFVTVATQGDSIYVKNLFPDSERMWLKGALKNGKAVFRRGDIVATRNGLKRLGVYDWKKEYKDDKNLLTLTPVEEALSFDYDPAAKTLSNPSRAFDYADSIDQEIITEITWLKPSAFINAEISPWRDIPLTPMKPRFIDTEYVNGTRIPVYSDYTISDISDEGMLMVSDRLYYRILHDDDIPFEVTVCDEDGNEHSTCDIPYNYINWYNAKEPTIKQEGCRWTIFYNIDDDIRNIRFQLFYNGGGEIRSSDPNWVPDGVDDVIIPSVESSDIFDLQGHRVDPERMSPGIYIRNGHKFVKR